MISSAEVCDKKINSNSRDLEFIEIIRICNQKLIKEKFDRYQIHSYELNGKGNSVEIIRKKKFKLKNCDELDDSLQMKDVMPLVENTYKKKLLTNLKAKKTFLNEVNIN
jgi:hypothetical protein